MKSATDSPSGISSVLDVVEPERLDLASEENANDSGPNVIDMGRSDIELRIDNTVFKTHAHLLAKFARLEDSIDRNSSSDTGTRSIKLDRDGRGAEDMANTFKILYASIITGPFEFEPPILISALRIATVYDYPALRTFAVEHLEKANLGPIQRIELAREFGLTPWEGPAYDELYTRDEALTDQEAQILGVIAFAKVARMREREKLETGRAIGKREFKGALDRAERSLIEEDERAKAQSEETKRSQKEAKEQEEKKGEKKEITADETLRWYREAPVREARERRERQEKAKAEAEERERKRKEAVEREERDQREKIERDIKDSTEKDNRERGDRAGASDKVGRVAREEGGFGGSGSLNRGSRFGFTGKWGPGLGRVPAPLARPKCGDPTSASSDSESSVKGSCHGAAST